MLGVLLAFWIGAAAPEPESKLLAQAQAVIAPVAGASVSVAAAAQSTPPAAAPAPLGPQGQAAVDRFLAAVEAERIRQAGLPAPSSDGERLERMGDLDQAVRRARQAVDLSVLPENERDPVRRVLIDRMKAVDVSLQADLLQMVPPEGWFYRSRYGEGGARAAFLIVQHSNPDLWRRFLPVLEPLIGQGEVSGPEYALMFDRLRMTDGLPQRYGTQVTCPYGSGKWSLWEIEDRDRVDERRAAMGLGPLAEFFAPYEHDKPKFC